MARQWTEAQQRAINQRGGDILVSAAAGSGKTSVLVERIIRRLLDPVHPVGIDQMLVVTFTEAAAGEMKERIRRALRDVVDEGGPASRQAAMQLRIMGGAAISTLHAFCLQIIRRFFYVVGLDPRFRILDEHEAGLVRHTVLDDVFEQLHGTADDTVRRVLLAYGGRRHDTALRQIVLTLHDYLASLPQGDAWLNAVVAAYDRNSDGWDDAVADWQRVIFEEAQIGLDHAGALLEQAIQLARHPRGPGAALETFHTARAMVGDIASAVARQDWDATRDELASLRWPRRRSGDDSDPALLGEVRQLWDEVRKTVNERVAPLFGRSLKEELDEIEGLGPVVATVADVVRQFDAALVEAKSQLGAVDFSDLEQLALRVLTEENSPALETYRHRFEEVLVDEYQDINPVQDALIRVVSGDDDDERTGKRFMVGDVKQSIYRFRLADPGIFLHMQHAFSQPDAKGRHRIDLSANFRSTPAILHFVNYVFRQTMHPTVAGMAYDKSAALVAGRVGAGDDDACTSREGGQVAVSCHLIDASLSKEENSWKATDGADQDDGGVADEVVDDDVPIHRHELEALAVAQLIRRLVKDGYTYKDIAILMRSPRNVIGTVVEVLERHGVPAYAHAGSGFFKAVEVEVVLSLLRVIDNPRQDVPLAAVMRSPVGHFNENDLATVRAAFPEAAFHEAVRQYAVGYNDALSQRLNRLLHRIDAWRTVARSQPLSRLVHTLYTHTGYREFVAALPGGRRRQANLQELHARAADFDREGAAALRRFIESVDQLAAVGKEVAPPPILGEDEDVVSIMSVHKSKGLEFPVVIVMNIDRKWQTLDTRGDMLFHHDVGIGTTVVDEARRLIYPSIPYRAAAGRIKRDAMAEEMRLLYVALTRAEEQLLVIGSVDDLQNRAVGWCQVTRHKGWELPLGTVAGAGSWLDWIGAALCRHRDGAPLRELAAGALGPAFYEPSDEAVANHPPVIGVHTWRRDDVSAGAIERSHAAGMPGVPTYVEVEGDGIHGGHDGGPDDDDGQLWDMAGESPDRLRALMEKHGMPRADEREAIVALQEELQALAGWSYPFEVDTHRPAKLTVTELARHADDDDMTWVAPAAGVRRPFTPVSGKVDPRLKGIATHLFLAKLPLSGTPGHGAHESPSLHDFSRPQSLQLMLERMCEEGIMRRDEAKTIDLNGIARFFNTDLGGQLWRAARHGRVWRELPFTMRLPDRETIVQGTLDCLFQLDGAYVLIDYKTDRVLPGDEVRMAQGTYTAQIGYYMDFARRVTHNEFVRGFIVFLETGAVVPMDGPSR